MVPVGFFFDFAMGNNGKKSQKVPLGGSFFRVFLGRKSGKVAQIWAFRGGGKKGQKRAKIIKNWKVNKIKVVFLNKMNSIIQGVFAYQKL